MCQAVIDVLYKSYHPISSTTCKVDAIILPVLEIKKTKAQRCQETNKWHIWVVNPDNLTLTIL